MDVYVVDANVPLLCGRNTLTQWRAKQDFEQNLLEVTMNKKHGIQMKVTEGGHFAVELFKAGELKTDETVILLKEERDVTD